MADPQRPNNGDAALIDDIEARVARAEERIGALDRLLEAKFVRIEAMIRYEADKVALALSASDKAITKAENATEKRLEAMNEFRAQLGDQAKTFLTRDTFDTFVGISSRDREELHKLNAASQLAIRQGIADVTLSQSSLMTREQVGDTMKLVEAGIERNREDIQALKSGQGRMAGIAIGVSATISAFGVVAAILASSGH